MMRKKSDDAVSPVIGVMLLLVVTIVVAAVVAVFASGVGTGAEPVPTTVLDVTEIRDEGESTGMTTADGTVQYTYSLDTPQIQNELMNELGISSAEAAMDFNTDWVNSVTFEYKGHTVRWDDVNFVLYVDGVPLTEEDVDTGNPTALETVVNTPAFNVIESMGGWRATLTGSTPGTSYYPVTVTITSSAGDILDMQKVSIKVYKNSVLVAEKDSLSGSLAPGDKQTIWLNEIMNADEGNFNPVRESEKVEVFVLYGEHILVSEEMKVRR